MHDITDTGNSTLAQPTEYDDKPKLKRINYKALNATMKHSQKWKLKDTKTYKIEKTDYGKELDKITNSKDKKRDFKRFIKKYNKNLDTDIHLMTSFNNTEIWYITDGLLYALSVA